MEKGLARQAGQSLVEVGVSLTIAAVAISSSMNGYVLSACRAEWSAYSLAAHSQAVQKLEQVRAAKWDTTSFPEVDEVAATNFPVTVSVLDVPLSGTNIVHATNRTTIATVSANPPLKLVRVDSVWSFMNRGVFTNTVVSYRAPDQ